MKRVLSLVLIISSLFLINKAVFATTLFYIGGINGDATISDSKNNLDFNGGSEGNIVGLEYINTFKISLDQKRGEIQFNDPIGSSGFEWQEILVAYPLLKNDQWVVYGDGGLLNFALDKKEQKYFLDKAQFIIVGLDSQYNANDWLMIQTTLNTAVGASYQDNSGNQTPMNVISFKIKPKIIITDQIGAFLEYSQLLFDANNQRVQYQQATKVYAFGVILRL